MPLREEFLRHRTDEGDREFQAEVQQERIPTEAEAYPGRSIFKKSWVCSV